MLISLAMSTLTFVLIIAAVVLVLGVGLYILIFINTTKKLYHKTFDRRKPIPQVDRSPMKIDQSTIYGRGLAWFYTNRMEFINVRIKSFDGTPLCGYYRPSADRSTRNCVILVHGYNEHPANMACYAKLFLTKFQCHVLIIHQRAHHMSGGKVCTYGLRESVDLDYWIKFMKARAGGGARIYLMGRSVGALTCLLAAAQKTIDQNVCGIIADCPGSSLTGLMRVSASKRFRRDPAPFIKRIRQLALKNLKIDIDRCDIVSIAYKIKVPVLIFQCGEDNIAPPGMQVEIFDALRCPKRMVMVESAGHLEAYDKATAMYEREVGKFIETCVVRLVKNGMM